MQQPEVVRIITLKKVETFQAGKKCSPASGEVTTTLKPEPLNPSIVGRPVSYETAETR